MLNKQLTSALHLLLLSAVIGLLLLPLFQRGMFSDGVAYATIARNMAMGIGSLQVPYFTSAVFPQFFEHPPLGLWLQSFLFKAFGDHYYTERLFCLIEIMITFATTAYLWRRSFANFSMRHFYWVPILLLMLNPLLVANLYSNMLDSTVLCFGLLASACLMDTERMGHWRWVACMLAAGLIFAGFLSNGPVILFALVIPLLSCVIRRDRKFTSALIETLIILFALTVIAFCVFTINHGLWSNIKNYVITQVLPSTMGNRSEAATTGVGRLLITKKIIEKILPGLGLLVLLWLCRQVKLTGFNKPTIHRDALFYTLLGLCASLPIALAHRQSSNYVLPAMPYFALAIAQYVTPACVNICQKLSHARIFARLLFIISLCTFVVSIAWFAIQHDSLKRDEDTINDVKAISRIVGTGNNLIAGPGITNQYWVLVGYFGRYQRINLVRSGDTTYYLTDSNQKAPKPYQLVHTQSTRYRLYTKGK